MDPQLRPLSDLLAGASSFPITICFPGLHKEYLPLLPTLSKAFGKVIETPPTAASMVARVARLPLVRVIVSSQESLPPQIILPSLSRGDIPKRVEYASLLSQCYYYREMGHIAWACPKRQARQARAPTTTTPPRADSMTSPSGGSGAADQATKRDPQGPPNKAGWQEIRRWQRRSGAERHRRRATQLGTSDPPASYYVPV